MTDSSGEKTVGCSPSIGDRISMLSEHGLTQGVVREISQFGTLVIDVEFGEQYVRRNERACAWERLGYDGWQEVLIEVLT